MTTSLSIPQISGLPLIGNLLAFRADRTKLFARIAHECGDMGVYRLGTRKLILITAPELTHAVLVEHATVFDKTPFFRTYMRPMLGNGLLTIAQDLHRKQRKLVAPAFQHRRIAAYATVMAEYADQIQRLWSDGTTIDVAREMMRLTLWIVGKTLFDAHVLDEAEELGQALTTALRAFNAQVGSVVPIPPTWPTPLNRRAQRAIARLKVTIARIIADRRMLDQDRGDLLSMLLQAQYEDDGSRMSDQQVHDEVMTLFLAGHETTANALAWTWMLLAQHPDVYARMRAEVDRVLGAGATARTPGFDDLVNLPYTLQVFKEALRLYPPVPMLVRQATQSITLGGYALPAGSVVVLSPAMLHRRPEAFPDPERFDPDRWTPEAEARLPVSTYLPFGSGPRVCIGNHFAMMEGHVVLATLAQRVLFTLVEGQRIEQELLITLRPRYGIAMQVQHR